MFQILRRVRKVRQFSTSSTMQVVGEKIGFIGLGNMGAHMAINLVNKGHPLVIHDVNDASVEMVKKEGGEAVQSASNPAEVAADVSIVVTMLPSTPHTKEVYMGEKGVLSTVRNGSLLLDSTTLDPSMCKTVAAKAAEKGAQYLDTPVSGGILAARDGNLTFMVGGPEKSVAYARTILQKMGKNIVHCGEEVGSGEITKLCNNLLLAVSMIGASEAMNLGIQLGLDPKTLANVLSTSTGRCWSVDTYNPVPGVFDGVPSSRDYEGGFQSVLMLKDLGLAQEAATNLKVPIPLGSLARNMYQIICQKGLANKDFSSMYKFLKEN